MELCGPFVFLWRYAVKWFGCKDMVNLWICNECSVNKVDSYGFLFKLFLFYYSNFVCSLWWNISGLHYLLFYYYLYNSVLYQYLGGFAELGLIVLQVL